MKLISISELHFLLTTFPHVPLYTFVQSVYKASKCLKLQNPCQKYVQYHNEFIYRFQVMISHNLCYKNQVKQDIVTQTQSVHPMNDYNNGWEYLQYEQCFEFYLVYIWSKFATSFQILSKILVILCLNSIWFMTNIKLYNNMYIQPTKQPSFVTMTCRWMCTVDIMPISFMFWVMMQHWPYASTYGELNRSKYD